MIKVILMVITISCSKIINELRNINKGINEDLIEYCKNENVRNKDKLIELIKKGADVNFKDEKGNTPLLYAIRFKFEAEAEILLNAGADIHFKDKGSSISRTVLMCALANNCLDIAKLLIEEGVNINEKDIYYATALMYSLEYKHIEIAKLLIEKGANVNDKDELGFTALMLGSENGNLEIVKLLIEKGANVNAKNNYGDTALIKVFKKFYHNFDVNKNYVKIVKLLSDNGANFEELNSKVDNAPMFIIQKIENLSTYENTNEKIEEFKGYYIELLRMLLKKEINANYKYDKSIISCLHYVFLNENIEIIKEIVSVGTNIYKKDVSNKTVMLYVSEKIRNCKDKFIKDKYIELAYVIIKKMSDDYIQLFISMNKDSSTPQEAKDEVNNHINILYSLQKLPLEVFIEIIKNF